MNLYNVPDELSSSLGLSTAACPGHTAIPGQFWLQESVSL